MFLKKFKNIIIASLISLFIMPISAFAYSSYVIPGGENIGIQINSKGIIIVGLYKVNGRYPGKEAGLRVGDKILSINNLKVNSISDMVNKINNSHKKTELAIQYERNNLPYETKLYLDKSNNETYKTGLYVKDSINGIGTLTFIDPNTKIFGALGHEILEKNTGQKVEVRDGTIFKSEVIGIDKSIRGSPGEKNAKFYSNIIYGYVTANTPSGVFGIYKKGITEKPLLEVAKPSEVETGKATIYTVLKDETVEEFTINILKTNDDQKQKQKNIFFEITDQRLLEETGGIVQGMSGSPIIQNNKLVGAVTHVIIDDSKRGYGIFITNMLKEAEN
ncbi:MAG: SpoIVB peptidase [Bacilli bacterium]|nr:SpoIVB peptidase [Bacilli bacterium]